MLHTLQEKSSLLTEVYTPKKNTMKKTTLLLMFLFSLVCFAQKEGTETINQVKEKAVQSIPYTSNFTQAKHFPMIDNPSISKGKLFFTGDKMSMIYAAPSSDVLVINGDMFYMLSNGKKIKVNTTKSKKIKNLKNTLLNCMSGNIAAIATENGAETTVKTVKGETIISLTKPESKKNSDKRSYHLIKLTYDKNLQLKELYMEEMSGIYNVYQIANTKSSANINEDVFNIN